MDLKEFDSLSVKDRCRLVNDATAWFCVFSEIIMNKNFALFFCDAKVHIEVIKIVLGNYYDKIVKSEDKSVSVLEKINLGDSVYLITSCEFISCKVDSETGFMECPFENDCDYLKYDECRDSNRRVFETVIDGIYDNGNGRYITAKGFSMEISIYDFGKYIFLKKELKKNI